MSSSLSELECFFPLRNIDEVNKLFREEIKKRDPDLAMLSIIIGALEHQFTQGKNATASVLGITGNASSSSSEAASTASMTSPCQLLVEPPLSWSMVEALKAKFESVVAGFCDSVLLRDGLEGGQIRPLVKHVADIVWNTLTKSHYKDRPHLQSIYSYLTGNKLDCFGVAFAVVAACQLLNIPNVHLALSEDHAWVVFGQDGTETAEVTWHGKGNEDKRGQPVEIAKAKTSWLYVAGQPVVCDRHMEVAAMISSINPAISANLDSIECGAMQQELLWILYDEGHLKNYPMALGNLADLEEISPSLGRPHCTKIFSEAIEVNKTVYANHHVYPYTYQAGYYYRVKEFKKALSGWAAAADVIKLYKYSKDDEEIYKEFMEIANELIPHTVKTASLNPKAHAEVLRDPECFSYILRFYDGICSWEEDSQTPVLHIGWAKPMFSTCAKFDADIRSRVQIPKEEGDEDEDDDDNEQETSGGEEGISASTSTTPTKSVPESCGQKLLNNNYYKDDDEKQNSELVPGDRNEVCDRDDADGQVEKLEQINSNSQTITSNTEQCDRNDEQESRCEKLDGVQDLIGSLSEGCKDNFLNVEFLLGRKGSRPFVRNGSGNPTSIIKRLKKKQRRLRQRRRSKNVNGGSFVISGGQGSKSSSAANKAFLELHSVKMRGLKNLLCAEKLNASAIQLQLTAQSQTEVKNRKGGEEEGLATSRPKRTRRE